jgi:hypothetical protein
VNSTLYIGKNIVTFPGGGGAGRSQIILVEPEPCGSDSGGSNNDSGVHHGWNRFTLTNIYIAKNQTFNFLWWLLILKVKNC